MNDPRQPTRAQASAEKRLRDLGVTMTFSPAPGVPHDHPERVPGCFRCEMTESVKRVNGDAR